jgi:hypothetical protein
MGAVNFSRRKAVAPFTVASAEGDAMSASAGLKTLTRFGFAARGLLYIVIALLLIRSGRSEDTGGALAELGRSGGDPLLLAMATGFIAYGLWRFADAALNIEFHDGGAKGVRQRLAAAGSGAAYLFVAWQAVRLITGGGAGSGDPQERASAALELPGGPLLLIIGGAVLVGAGLYQMVKAYNCSFCDRLDPRIASRPAVRWIGRAGYAARGVIFIVSGFFVFSAGFEDRASEAGGIQEALRWLDSPVDFLVAAGLLLFGLFSILEARFRVIHQVPLDTVARAAGAATRPGI